VGERGSRVGVGVRNGGRNGEEEVRNREGEGDEPIP